MARALAKGRVLGVVTVFAARKAVKSVRRVVVLFGAIALLICVSVTVYTQLFLTATPHADTAATHSAQVVSSAT